MKAAKVGMRTVLRRILSLALLLLGLGWTVLSRPAAASTTAGRIPAPQVGFLAPAFKLTDLDGQTVNLSDYQGQVVLFNFWASWCPPCRSEMPAIQQVYESYRDQGLEVLAVNASYQDTSAAMQTFLGSFEHSFPILLDENGAVNQAVRGQFPAHHFFHRQGWDDTRVGCWRTADRRRAICPGGSPAPGDAIVFPVLNIGPAAIRTSGLLLLLGIYLGLTLSERFARRGGKNPDTLTNLVLLAGLAGLVAARLAYTVGHLALLQKNLAGLVSLDPSLLDPWGGLVGAGIAALIYAQRKQLKFWATLDDLTPFLALMAVFIGLAHAASGQAFGSPTTLPWAIELWGARRHPSQIYETIGAIAILILLWKQYGSAAGNGILF